jgi:hypothetical protein
MSTPGKTDFIKNREDLAGFVNDLAKNFRENPDSWTNRDVGSYLEAMAAWIEDMDGYYLNNRLNAPEKPEWKNVADMLIAAKLYE